MKKIIKTIFFICLALDAAIFVAVYFLGSNIAQSYSVTKGDFLQIDSFLPVTAEYSDAKKSNTTKTGDTFEVDLKMFGVIPFSRTQVKIVDEMQVAVLGNPFGMKIYTDGVLVIDLSDVNTKSGKQNPAKSAGIKIGDYIKSVNGKKITCNEDLSNAVIGSFGKEMKFKIIRESKEFTAIVKPVLDGETGVYRAGIWVRDSSAGIGTLTFYCPSTNVICGLGHGICDNETGSLLNIDYGEMVSADITSVKKSESGKPGELKGKFTFDTVANIDLNSKIGVYGQLNGKIDISNLTKVALKQEIKNGKAQILCTVDGDRPKLYSCEIKKRNTSENELTQNLLVTITDEKLLAKTGGVVQGMSGSPILQNGKLVGAVTHVLIDDPTKGYAIFAENMLETAQSVAESNSLKDAS